MTREIGGSVLSEVEKAALYGAVLLDPPHLDGAIIGIAEPPRGTVAVYEHSRLVALFAHHDGMSVDDAIEWVDYNTLRALPYLGPRAPWIVTEAAPDDDEETTGYPILQFNRKRYARVA